MADAARDTRPTAPWNEALAQATIAKHAVGEGSLLVVLQALLDAFGHVPEAAIPIVAHALNLSRAEVHGVVTFYHDFRRAPPGRHVLKLCRAEACQAMGGERLADHASRKSGVAFGETSVDGTLSLESVYCLGLCACAPAGLIDDRPVARLSESAIDALLEDART